MSLLLSLFSLRHYYYYTLISLFHCFQLFHIVITPLLLFSLLLLFIAFDITINTPDIDTLLLRHYYCFHYHFRHYLLFYIEVTFFFIIIFAIFIIIIIIIIIDCHYLFHYYYTHLYYCHYY
jgi:hypothetical protein